jgi:hypothetical protein
MAQTLQEFETQVQEPLREVHASLPAGPAAHRVAGILRDSDEVKRTFRKKLQAFAADCVDLMPSDVDINAFEPVIRR